MMGNLETLRLLDAKYPLGRKIWKAAETLGHPDMMEAFRRTATLVVLCPKCFKEALLVSHGERAFVVQCPGCNRKEAIRGKTLAEVAADDGRRRLEAAERDKIILDMKDRVHVSSRRQAALLALPLPVLQRVGQQVTDHPENAHRTIGEAIHGAGA